MPLTIRYLDGADAGRTLTFGDDVALVVLGRDPSCQVLFPPGEMKVGSQHCALKRVLGRYRLVLDTEHHVSVGGKPAHDEFELAPLSILQLGPEGPRVEASVEAKQGLTRTIFQGGRRPQMGEMVQQAQETARSTWKIAAASAAITLAVAAAGYWLFLRTREAEKRAEKAETKVSSVVDRQASALDEVRKKVSGMEEQLSHAEPAMKAALRKAEHSVYVVLFEKEDGTQFGGGTAWVVAPGTLATNAHVAAEFTGLPQGARMFVRSNASPPKDHRVVAVEVHPGYDAFAKVVDTYAPHERAGPEGFTELMLVPACDVALMKVEDPEALAPPLPLADAEALKTLASPDTIGLVGYPREKMVGSGVNVRQPEPTVQMGHVTGVTDFFFRRDVGGGGQLVQHSLPTAGGASGSPIIDATGKVVAVHNAGNFSLRMTEQGLDRTPLAVGVNFAQRVDLVQELLDGRAVEVQAERTKRWEEDIKQFVSSKDVFEAVSKKQLASLTASWLEANGWKTLKTVNEQSAELPEADGEGHHVWRTTIRKPDGPLLMIVMPSRRADMDLYVFRGGAEEILGKDEEQTFAAAVALNDQDALDLDVAAVGPDTGVPFTLHVYTAE